MQSSSTRVRHLRHLCGAMSDLKRPVHRMRVTRGMREDLTVWKQFLDHFNGVSFWRSELSLRAEVQVNSDAAGALGFGIYFRGRWYVVLGQRSGTKRA